MNKIIWPSVLVIGVFAFALWLRKRDKEDATAFASSAKGLKGVPTALMVEDRVVVQYDSPQVVDDLQAANLNQNKGVATQLKENPFL